jgi:hypothetical protein
VIDPAAAESWSDRELVRAAAQVVSQPKQAPADSFLLHAPLELLARAQLLSRVRSADREGARQRIVAMADQYEAAGPSVEPPASPAASDPADLAGSLLAAVTAGELDDVDVLAAAFGSVASALDVRRLLADGVVASLAAAAHASILLSLLPRVASADLPLSTLVRGPARELARNPDWQLRWFEHPDEPGVARSLADALAEVPQLGVPGSTFIYPVMDQAESSGVAASLLGGVAGLRHDGPPPDLAAINRDLSRIAAWSMVQEPTEHARYGWTHCLTMPQAVLVVGGDGADPHRAAAIAATHVVGFRAALGQREIDPEWAPAPSRLPTFEEALAVGPDEAAAWAWHVSTEGEADLVQDLITRASLQHDAHVVKYTLASLDAAAADPDASRLHLAAVAFLLSLWHTEGGPGA